MRASNIPVRERERRGHNSESKAIQVKANEMNIERIGKSAASDECVLLVNLFNIFVIWKKQGEYCRKVWKQRKRWWSWGSRAEWRYTSYNNPGMRQYTSNSRYGYHGENNKRDERRYSDVVNGRFQVKRDTHDFMATKKEERTEQETGRGCKKEACRIVEVSEDQVETEILKRSIVGEVKSMCFLTKLPKICEEQGLSRVEVKLLGGLEIMIVFETSETVNNILCNGDHGIRRWLHKLRRWDDDIRSAGRFSSVNIIGVPVACWSESTFRKIASLHGNIIGFSNCRLEDFQDDECESNEDNDGCESENFNNNRGDDKNQPTAARVLENRVDEVSRISLGTRVHVQIREENNYQGFIIAENGKDECIRKRGDLSPNANSSGGDRIRKKRKADDEGGFVSESKVNSIIYAAGYIGSSSGNKKTGRKGEDKKGISDAYKEYSVEEHNMNEKAIAVGEERTDLDTHSCSISLEQVKEIGELIGVSWIRVEEQKKNERNNCGKIYFMKIVSVNVRGFGDIDKKGWVKPIINEERPDVIGIQETKCGMVDECWIEGGKGFGFTQLEANGNSGGIMVIWDNNSFTCKEAMGDERFIVVKGEWKGKDGDVFLDRLSGLMERMGGAWCIFRDFNVVRYCEDRLNCQVNTMEMSDFNGFINSARLVEVPMGGWKFTRVSDDGIKFSKLVRFLLNDEFASLWGNLSVVALDRKHSDHCPIVLKNLELDFGPKPFRFFDVLLKEPDIGQVVEEAWKMEVTSIRPDCCFRDKLKNVKQVLKKWSKERFGTIKKKIEYYKREAMRWELEAEKRNLNEDERSAWMEARRLWMEKENENKSMLRQKARREFSETEVWEAIKACGGDKAPGPDGFNFKFIRGFWNLLKPDLMGAVKWFWERMEISKGCNSSFVTIIPKVADPIELGDFRPISLIGCYYKIIAKVLLERIKKVVGNVVGDIQSAFIKGRFILDIMKMMGFGLKWCRWVENCLSSSTMSILVNGSPTEEFRLERGVRQGDPLSPFLFIIAAEGLNAIVKEAVAKGIFNGVRVGSNQVVVSHLQYADDTIFFGEWSRENARSLMCILKCFEQVSGLRVNYSKSKLYGVGVNEEEIGEMARFNRLFHPDRRKDDLVADKGRWVNSQWQWEWDWGRNLRGRSNDCRDRWRWKLNDNGEFTVRGLTALVEEKILRVENDAQETLWNKWLPKKVNIFVWRALKGRLPVHEEFDKRGVDLDSLLCPCCDSVVETCAHSLVTCNLAMSVWEKIFSWWKVGNVNAFSIFEMFSNNGNVAVPNLSSRLWQTVVWTAGYYIWKERNDRVFKGKVSSTNKIVQDIQLKSYEWIVRRSTKKIDLEWQLWLFDPGKCHV
ncbi:Transposon TX1 [Artemisia annua]|uniref:Transposon TX1 n=1 Tax=Artemisia annua TaxID=35608 RepID=A0A2U1MQ04_ARTAN|nr:Transposon TX1 [Artemisia annua]